jgi:hypothetical protein
MYLIEPLKNCATLQWKILTLQASEEELLHLERPHLLWGLFWVWMAGIGRAWDLEKASIFDRLGVGSVFYIFALTTFLFLFIWPLRPHDWSWRRLLTFVSMTGIVGLLYAVPLELMLPPAQAVDGNTIFLFIVATWRVLMLGMFLLKTTQLEKATSLIALVLPLSLIVNVLLWTDHMNKTFSVMGGIRRYYVAVDPNKTFTEKELYDMGLYPISDKTGRAKGQAYTSEYLSKAPEGFKEIGWDNSQYMPPSLLLMVLKPLGLFCQVNSPILFLAYLYLAITGNGRKPIHPKPPELPEQI